MRNGRGERKHGSTKDDHQSPLSQSLPSLGTEEGGKAGSAGLSDGKIPSGSDDDICGRPARQPTTKQYQVLVILAKFKAH